MRLLILISLLISSAVYAENIPNPKDIILNEEGYDYAPRQKVTQGSPLLTCVGIKYQGQTRYTSATKCKTIANKVRDFYKTNSRGLLDFKTVGYMMEVPFKQTGPNYNKAVQMAKAKYPNSPYYIITGNPGTSHAGKGVAFLKNTPLYRDAQHEVGHLLKLGHSGRYVLEKGKWILEAYGDGQSVMSRFPSSTLAGPQYYSRGWLLDKEAAIYEPDMIYEVKKVNNFKKEGPLGLVIVKPKDFNLEPAPDPVTAAASVLDYDEEDLQIESASDNARSAYISYPPNCDGCLSIHLAIANGGGTQKVATFGNKYFDKRFTGMNVEILEKTKDTIKFSVDFPGVPLKTSVPSSKPKK